MNDAEHRARARQLFEQIIRHSVEQSGCTLAGWYWYCDDCQNHGNADTEAEAWIVARAHEQYKSSIRLGDARCELCVIRIGQRDTYPVNNGPRWGTDTVRPSTP